ncbi:MAG: diphosphomevalonate decarboxylase [Lactobacillales bacterium]|jgi:diphosphomevalonate decarboxylase|nr:diphosphomevalonate decarboxylase [Lactobacillales bacterium]
MKKTGKARAYTNIALIKYWGKKDKELILPMNSSLSLTLDAFYTETKITFDESFTQDTFYLNGELQEKKGTQKISSFLKIVFEKYDLPHLFAKVESHNFVPTAAGLASSASGFAALAGAVNQALDLQLSDSDLSKLARRGSGSASRSIYGGFAEWKKGTDDDTSYAVQIPSKPWDIGMLFVVLNKKTKKISSRVGMEQTVNTSPFYPAWVTSAEQDIVDMKQAIAKQDFKRLGELAEFSAMKMHATVHSSFPPFTYWEPESLVAQQIVRDLREEGIPVYFTMDAGPNVKILAETKNFPKIKERLYEYFDKEAIIEAFPGMGLTYLEE